LFYYVYEEAFGELRYLNIKFNIGCHSAVVEFLPGTSSSFLGYLKIRLMMDKPFSYKNICDRKIPSMELKSLCVRDTDKGKSVFAMKDFSRGNSLLEFTGKIISRDEYLEQHDPENNHYLQIDYNRFMGPSGGMDDLINHSCNPNCGLIYSEDKIILIAIYNIHKNEEITFDYSTTMDEDCWEMECHCGEVNCREVIRDFKYLPYQLKIRYISLGIVPDFIANRYCS
jgi:hypothetical protein